MIKKKKKKKKKKKSLFVNFYELIQKNKVFDEFYIYKNEYPKTMIII